MARWARFRCSIIEDLHRQLAWSGDQARRRMLAGALGFVREVDDTRLYPIEFVTWRLTHWRPDEPTTLQGLPGEALRGDLVTMVQRISHRVPGDLAGADVLLLDDVASQLGVSRRSVERLRLRGLVMSYWRCPDGQLRLGCDRADLKWFQSRVDYQPRTVSKPPIERIKSIAQEGGVAATRESTVRMIVGDQPTLSVATIRGVLRRLEDSGAIQRSTSRRLTQHELTVAVRGWWRGVPVSHMAKRFGVGEPAMHRAILRQRRDLLQDMVAAWEVDPVHTDTDDAGGPAWDAAVSFGVARQPNSRGKDVVLLDQAASNFAAVVGDLSVQPSAVEVDTAEVAMRAATRHRWRVVLHLMPLLEQAVTLWAGRSPLQLPPALHRVVLVGGVDVLYEAAMELGGLPADRVDHRIAAAVGRFLASLPAIRGDLAASLATPHVAVPLRSLLPAAALLPDPRWEKAAMHVSSDQRSIVVSRWGLSCTASHTLAEVATMQGTSVAGLARRWASAQRQLIKASRSCK